MSPLHISATGAVVGGSPLGGHLWHLLLLAAWIPIYALMIAYERIRKVRAAARRVSVGTAPEVPRSGIDERTVTSRQRLWLPAMACFTACSALVHAAVLPDHLRQSLWYGAFFLLLSVGQLLFAGVLITRPSRVLVRAGVVGLVVIIGLWLFTRVVGVPIGPDHGATESFGLLDVYASCAEGVAALCGIRALRTGVLRPMWRWSSWSVSVQVGVPMMVTLTTLVSLVGSRS